MITFRTLLVLPFLLLLHGHAATAQPDTATYRYHLDLTGVDDDRLEVVLQTPAVDQKSIVFHMPNIIPGTYMESNYGMFVSDFRAFDKRGRSLKVERLGQNSWKINRSHKLDRIQYTVEDTYDTNQENPVYGMSGTNIEAGKNFVIHTPGFFGYLEGMKEQPFEVTITKPETFYGSTGLIPAESTPTSDRYHTGDYDLLMDSPMMYNEPDTTFIDVANARVLVSVYSPQELITSDFLAERFASLLEAQAQYMGGNLPVDKYAFIMYFAEPGTIQSGTGALEHSYSSFYYMPEGPEQQYASLLVDIASHEFFHIVTPLNIHSEEIAYFNYEEPDLSKHLWLYEGVTEYAAHHAQVKSGLIDGEEFLARLEQKINTSLSNFDDSLPFTMVSEQAAGKYKGQYTNVYQKGALIGAMLDIALLDATGNEMNLQELIARLSQRYGKHQPFKDDELFDVIASMSDPTIADFFNRYVAGSESLPYRELFDKAGVRFEKEPDEKVATLGNITLNYNQNKQRIYVSGADNMNDFGQAMGFQTGDLIISVQGEDLSPAQARAILGAYETETREGDTVRVVVERPDENGDYREVTLEAPAMLVNREGNYTLRFIENPTFEQRKLRNRWLYKGVITANPEDVDSIDAIVTALYDVISGPAGPRDWDRMNSLFKPDAGMATIATNRSGDQVYAEMTREEYQKRNGPIFMKNDFYEEEIGRQVFRYGRMATVQTAYQFRFSKDGEPRQRGINTVQLVHEQGRWWITRITWTNETEDNPIPDELLNSEPSTASQ